ncbi:Gfo/Idh/MocA family protein [Salinarimonas ramus]|uniref:Dehydrogenase n=1 Tax=Salinarimonas ramus TaxID=690164 RepID=A0A917Q8E3_9HYPH|nr:Gfo/Idh/MocA family oxidoreductase [Salinarimonas ramus]GGK35679.1 dehydrogenase [Salinarimonas ramus]
MTRVAIVGMGWWGRTLARSLADSETLRPILAVDPHPAGREAGEALGLAVVDDLRAACARADVDAVLLCSPHRFHAEQIEIAAAAGKHVFCEKPLCTTAAEAERALAAVRRAGIVLGIGHERRFEPAIRKLRERIAAGEIGTILAVEGNFSQDKFLSLPPDNWRLSPSEAPVGPLSATGIHMVDLAIAVLGRPDRVWARLATRGSSFANGDTLSVTVAFPGGASATITALLATPFVGRFAVYGSRGWIEIRDRTHPESPSGWDVEECLRGGERVSTFWPPHPAVRDNLDAFAAALRGEAPYPVTLDEMEANVRTFEAVTRSAASGAIETV